MSTVTRSGSIALAGAALFLATALFVLRLAAGPEHVDSMDGVYFVRGVERYSLAESRPHWPGYPIYVGAAKVLHGFGLSPIHALRVLSAAGWTACLFLIAALVRGRRPWPQAAPAALAAAAVWGLAPAAWFGGQAILSDVPALALALATLWLAARAETTRAETIAGGVLAGLTAGVRLPYAVLIAPWLAGQVSRWKRAPSPGRWTGLAAVLVPAVASVALWVAWQVVRDPSFLALGAERIHAHLGNFHRRVLSQPGVRLVDLAHTFAVYGIGAWMPRGPLVRLPLTLLLAAAVARGAISLRHQVRLAWLLALWTLPYLLLVLVANDPRLARYTLPLLAALAVVAGLGLPARRAWGWATAAVLAAVAAIVPLARLARAQPPLPVQVTSYVAGTFDPVRDVLLITDDAGPLRPFLEEAGWPPEAVREERLLERAQTLAAAGRRVHATSPSMHAPERWSLEARFRRDRLLESRPPREIALFRYDTGR